MLLAGATALSGAAQSKFDAAGMMVMHTYAARLQNPTAELPQLDIPGADIALSGRADDRATLIVSLNEGATASDLEVRGFDILTDLGDILIVSGTMADIQDLESCDFVKAMSFGQIRKPMLDKAREDIKADDIHSGTGLGQAYTGKGVITGIFDQGLDPNHVNFNNSDNTTRIKRLWHFTGTSGSVIDYSSRVARFTTDSRSETHGTHTLGCMAGSYNGNGTGKVVTKVEKRVIGPIVTNTVTVGTDVANPYYGISTGSDIAAGCGILSDPNIIAAVQNVADYAKSESKPAVMNLSLGNILGPHDNSTLINQAMARLGKDMIICIAAGNDGDMPISIDRTFTQSNTEIKTLFGSDDSFTQATGYIDIWSDSSTPFTVNAIVYDRASGKILYELPVGGGNEGTVGLGTSDYYPSYNNDANFDKAYSGRSYVAMTASKNTATNKRYNVLATASLTYSSSNASRNLMLGFKVTGTPGQRIMMTATTNNAGFTNYRASGFDAGTGEYSINDMACGENTIAIGAYTTKDTWGILGTNDKGFVQAYNTDGLTNGNVSNFSGYAITPDGRSLPDVCAPGAAIVSSVSTYYVERNSDRKMMVGAQEANGRTNYWAAEQGTSMACPIAAGTIALWLEANPSLTVDEVRSILKETATKDEYVNNYVPATQWGAGKLNALEGLKKAISMAAGVNDVTIDGKDKLVLTAAGNNTWEIYMPYASAINAEVYNLAGLRMASANADGDTLTFTADGLEKGIYLISVNGTEARRILVR